MSDLEESALAVYFANCQGIKSDPLPMIRKILALGKVDGMYPREMCERMAAPNVEELAAELADARRVIGYLNHRVAWWKSQARKHKKALAQRVAP